MYKILQVKNKLAYSIKFYFIIGLLSLSYPFMANAQSSSNTVKATPQMIKETKVSIQLKNSSINTILLEIQKQSKIGFIFQNGLDPKTMGHYDLLVKDVTVEKALNTLFANTKYTYKIVSDKIVIEAVKSPVNQEIKDINLSGKILNAKNEPIIGATIIVTGTRNGAITDDKGAFSLRMTQAGDVEISCVGYTKQIKKITESSNNFNVKLENATLAVRDVVVTGYQKIDVRKNTSAITSVKMDDVLMPGMNSIEQVLEGRIPDLLFMNNSGEVGSTARIRIRGTSTIMGNREPLWVLDGFVMTDPVQVSNDDLNNPDYVNIIGNAIQGINPQDIERIDILKDASATALYGVRAANGVIVITTKRGSIGPVSISYNHQSKMTRRPRYSDRAIDLMNSQERVRIGKDLVDSHYVFPGNMARVGYEGAFYDWQKGNINYEEFQNLVAKFENVNTDWFDELTRDAYSQDHTLNVSGGTENLRYYSSIGYNKENGVTKSTFTDRMTARININAKLSEKFRLSYSLSGNLQNKNHLPSDIDAINYAYNTTRALPAYNEDGSYYFYDLVRYGHGEIPGQKYKFNVLNEMNNSYDSYKGNGINTMLDVNWKILDGLEVTLSGNYSSSSTTQERWWGEKTNYIARYKNGEYDQAPKRGEGGKCALPYGGILNSNFSSGSSWTARAQFDYRKMIGVDNQHQFSVSGGYEAASSLINTSAIKERGYSKTRGMQFIDVDNISDFPIYQKWMNEQHSTKSSNLSNMISGYAVIGYSYYDYFTVNANARFDASNKFGSRSNERFSPIWSASGMINFHEIFFKKVAFLSTFRVNGSFGAQGNMLDDQNPEFIIKLGTVDSYFGQNTSTAARFPNPNLRWEKTKQFNIGIDLGFFNNNLTVNSSIYQKNTTDLFTTVDVSSINGVPNYVLNGGDIQNKGFSIMLAGYVFRKKDFYWRLSTMYSINSNSVKSSNVDTYTYSNYLSGNAIVPGESISTFYSYKYQGLNPITGAPMFRDYEDQQHLLRGKSLEETVKTVMVNGGQREPKFSGSLSTTLKYKRLTLSAMASYGLGSKVRLFSLYTPVAAGIASDNNLRKEFVDRWKNPGDEFRTDIPAIISRSSPYHGYYNSHFSNSPISSGNSATQIKMFATNVWDMYDKSDLRVISGNYFKMSSISLRYELNPSLLEKLHVKGLSISASTRDLFTLSAKELKGQDPSQSGFASPGLSVRPSYTLQVIITF